MRRLNREERSAVEFAALCEQERIIFDVNEVIIFAGIARRSSAPRSTSASI